MDLSVDEQPTNNLGAPSRRLLLKQIELRMTVSSLSVSVTLKASVTTPVEIVSLNTFRSIVETISPSVSSASKDMDRGVALSVITLEDR